MAALKYMQQRGGTLIMHGYTHQYGNVANPYDGVSANDFEFYTAHVDANDSVIYDGPVAGDSAAWATSRIVASGADLRARPAWACPTIFEFPHYAASAVDYQTVNSLFGKRYDRGLYFPGVLTGAKFDYTRQFGQFFPYTVRDVYGSVVVPENIGNVEPDAFNNHPARLPADLLASADRNLVSATAWPASSTTRTSARTTSRRWSRASRRRATPSSAPTRCSPTDVTDTPGRWCAF